MKTGWKTRQEMVSTERATLAPFAQKSGESRGRKKLAMVLPSRRTGLRLKDFDYPSLERLGYFHSPFAINSRRLLLLLLLLLYLFELEG